ncbi:hypothetical protein E2C01_005309 [Portunus trituberculatus]|uniref:Uncharacterized protein n=1 Tax=Portunus trituberculatus TaxID=210409 RepID=A0A5B7CS70_PORTR|nr:hypothetical protein [Portunus trituberculatus]
MNLFPARSCRQAREEAGLIASQPKDKQEQCRPIEITRLQLITKRFYSINTMFSHEATTQHQALLSAPFQLTQPAHGNDSSP